MIILKLLKIIILKYNNDIHNINYIMRLVNDNISYKMYLYDNFYENNVEIVKLFERNHTCCKNPIIDTFKTQFETILDLPIQSINSNIVSLNNDYTIQHDGCQWLAIIFLNPNIPYDNGFAFMQENYNSNNKIQPFMQTNDPISNTYIVEDFLYGKPNRIILFNSKYHHKIFVKEQMLVEIIYIKI